MTDADKPRFGELLAKLAICLTHNLSKRQVVEYWDTLKGEMDLPTFERAFVQLRKTETWFPRPAQFLAASRIGWS